MIRVSILIISLVFCLISNGQNTVSINSDTTIMKYDLFELSDTLKMKVIQSCPTKIGCGILVFVSTTIGVIIDNDSYAFDTIAVFSICDRKRHRKYKVVNVIPSKEPTFGYITCYAKERKSKYSIFRRYGHQYPTTFGHIQRK